MSIVYWVKKETYLELCIISDSLSACWSAPAFTEGENSL